MTRARIALAVVLCVAVVAAVYALTSRTPAKRSDLLLLTSLPLMFGEDFSVESTGSPTLDALQKAYRVIPISVTDPAELRKGRLLLMAQPRAQPAEDLVALDDWVRNGGRVLILADPLLEWPSARPLGDPARPPSMFADTGLLAHWGLRLDAPDERGPQPRELAGSAIVTLSPGSLFGRCEISRDRLVAHCRIGRGQATIVADADFLNGDAGATGDPALLAELAQLQRS